MRRMWIGVAAAALVMASVNVAGAQGRRGGGGMFGGGLMMLRIKEVQTELKMTEAQISKLEGKQTEMQEKMREIFQGAGGGGFQNMSAEERQAMMTKIQDMQSKAVADLLETKQVKRFKQLELQQMGAQALGRKDIAEELKISADQKKTIQGIQTKQQEEMRAIMEAAGGPQNMSDDDRKKMTALRTSTNDKVMAVLTEAQKKQWKEMTGEAFKFPAMGPGGPGGRPGRP